MHAAPAILAGAALVSGAGPATADLAGIKNRGTLRVIVSADEAPETFDPKGGARPGFERELLESFARLQGLNVEVLPARGLADPGRRPRRRCGRGRGQVAAALRVFEGAAGGALGRRDHRPRHSDLRVRSRVEARAAATAGVTVGSTGSVAWAVRKEDVALRTTLDGHIANVRKSASWNLLLVKYFGDQAPLVLGRRR